MVHDLDLCEVACRQEEMRAHRAAFRVFGPRWLQAAVVFGQILFRNGGAEALACFNDCVNDVVSTFRLECATMADARRDRR